MTINHPILLITLDIFWLGFLICVWYLFVQRYIIVKRYWKHAPGKMTDIVVLGYVLRPYALCFFTFMHEGQEVKGGDFVPTTSVKKLKNSQTIQIAVNEKNPKKSIVCDMGWPLYGIPVFAFALMTILSFVAFAIQFKALFG